MEAANTNDLMGAVEMSNEAYHAAPGISKSHLDVIAKSDRHYWAKYLDPDRVHRPIKPPTPAMILGSAIHSIILEPDLFTQAYVPNPGIERRSNAGKAEYAAFMAENAGKTILEDEDYQKCLTIRDVVRAHPVAGSLFIGGKAEESFFTVDVETGELVKCRTDYFNRDAGMIVDLKSTDDASPAGFAKSVVNFRYHLQPPWYQDVLAGVYGEAPPFWVFVAVEKEWPHAVGIYYPTADDIERARAIARANLRQIAECKARKQFTDYGTEALPLVLPPWAWK